MNTRNIILILTIIFTSLAMISCDEGRCIKGNRDVMTEYRTVEHFSGVISEGAWDVDIHRDSIFYVVVEAESNLMPYITTSVKNGDLKISTRDHRCINNKKPVRVHVYSPFVERASLEGSGNIEIQALEGNHSRLRISGSGNIHAGVWAKELEADITGSGEMNLWGEIEDSEMMISGSGNIKAYDLEQNLCFATVSGSGNMYLTVANYLDVRISGSGSVYYHGNPELHTSISGSGDVHHTW